MMQLATSQRPHPPPVPPRPSRQVVAEALKRSPRPPCPTRQAPPPPNTRPWRSEDRREKALPPFGDGRTVVYESVKDFQNIDELHGSSEPRATGELEQRVNVLSRHGSINEDNFAVYRSKNSSDICPGKTSHVAEKIEELCGSTSATSERNEAKNHWERQTKPHQRQTEKPQKPRSYSNNDWENSIARLNENNANNSRMDGSSSNSKDKILIVNEPRTDMKQCPLERTRGIWEWETKSEKSSDEKKTTPENNDFRFNSSDNPTSKIFHRESDKTSTEELTIENIGETTSMERYSLDDNVTETSLLIPDEKDNQNDETTEMKISRTPPKIEIKQNGKEAKEELMSRVEEEETAVSTSKFGSTTTISSDECATVVVIEKTERTIPLNEDNDNIHHQDWLEAGVRYSSTKITLPGDDTNDRHDESSHHDEDDDPDRDSNDEDDRQRRAYANINFASIRERIAMSSLQGLPPLPRSLSGFNLNEGRREVCEPPPPPARSSSKTPKNVKSTQPSSSRPSPPGRQLTTLDTQLAILRKEMFGLRQLDLSLLSQLWSLNESIQEFRQLLQDQEDRAPSPSPSSEDGDDISYGSHHPPPPPRRPAPLLHHHRPPRPPRPLRPPASDESPSSEEYGAV